MNHMDYADNNIITSHENITSGEIDVRSESITALSSVSGTTVTPSPFARTTETEEDGICERSIEA